MNYKTTTQANIPKKNDNVLNLFSPLINIAIIIAIFIGIIALILGHYLAIFRIRKETIKIRELLENSTMNNNDNKKND